MHDDPDLQAAFWLKDEQKPQWLADLAALRDCQRQRDLRPLLLGDLFNEQKARWGKLMPELARLALVPYHTARRHARVAAAFPPDHPLRASGLPYAILCLLAPLPDPQPWADQALALQKSGKLRVRDFARLLEEGGVRKPRAAKLPRCAHCSAEVPDTPERVFFRHGPTTGYLCSTPCALAHFAPPAPSTPSDPSDRSDPTDRSDSQPPTSAPRNPESQSAPSPPHHPTTPPPPSAPGDSRTITPEGLTVLKNSRPIWGCSSRPGTRRRPQRSQRRRPPPRSGRSP